MEESKDKYQAIIDPLSYPETLETEHLKSGKNNKYKLPRNRARNLEGKNLIYEFINVYFLKIRFKFYPFTQLDRFYFLISLQIC